MKNRTLVQKSPDNTDKQQVNLVWLLGFIACYVLSAAIFQAISPRPPWVDGSPIEYFTGSLLWMLSLVCLLSANKYSSSRWRSMFWLISCAALAALAIDEIFAFHERPEQLGYINDDHFKVVSWLAAAIVLFLILRMEAPSLIARCAIFTGYLFHSLYIFVEIGDGDYFRLPLVSRTILKWLEEFFELFFLASYLIGFILIYTTYSRETGNSGEA